MDEARLTGKSPAPSRARRAGKFSEANRLTPAGLRGIDAVAASRASVHGACKAHPGQRGPRKGG